MSKLNITSGSRTYRIPSPTRALKARGSPFQPSLSPPVVDPLPHAQVSSLDGDSGAEKGQFFNLINLFLKIEFLFLFQVFTLVSTTSSRKDPNQLFEVKETLQKRNAATWKDPKRPQNDETLRLGKFIIINSFSLFYGNHLCRMEKRKLLERELEEERLKKEEADRQAFLIQQQKDRMRARREASEERQKVAAASALVIGEQNDTDPVILYYLNPVKLLLFEFCYFQDLVDERERKKEKILMLSLQRRQQQEEARARKEAEAQRRREIEKEKEEEKARRKEEQAARRAAILEQYKLKKAIEDAEREVSVTLFINLQCVKISRFSKQEMVQFLVRF